MTRKRKEENMKSRIIMTFNWRNIYQNEYFLLFLVVLYFSVELFSNRNTKKKHISVKCTNGVKSEKGL